MGSALPRRFPKLRFPKLEELKKRVRNGEAKSRERKEGGEEPGAEGGRETGAESQEGKELVQKAKAALGGGDFEGAAQTVLSAAAVAAAARMTFRAGEKAARSLGGSGWIPLTVGRGGVDVTGSSHDHSSGHGFTVACGGSGCRDPTERVTRVRDPGTGNPHVEGGAEREALRVS